MMTVTSVL